MSKTKQPQKIREEILEEIDKKVHMERINSGEYRLVPGDGFHDNFLEILRLHDEEKKHISDPRIQRHPGSERKTILSL